MLDVNALTENLEVYKEGLAKRRAGELDLDEVARLNTRRKELQKQRDDLVFEQRELGPKIGQAKKAGKDAAELTARSGAIKKEIKRAEAEARDVEELLNGKLAVIPNLPHPEAPEGGEDDGVIRDTWGEPKTFDFEPKDHVALCDATGLVELGERATRLSGASFVVYMGQGARLVRALINFFLDMHTISHRYTEVAPPFLVNRTTMTGTGQLPKFEDDLYRTSDDMFLIPTAEVPVTNLHQGEILPEEDLPLGYCAYTPCFRREAGSAGKMTRGLKRLHQFDKVELVRFCTPETSDAQHALLLDQASAPLRKLGLHYRVKELATGDIGFSAARCYDLEAHSPATGEWLEVSSCSVFTDFQARRANIRCKGTKKDGKKPKARFVHTLNASGLALPRVIVAILETYQRADGKVDVPEALLPYMAGIEVLG